MKYIKLFELVKNEKNTLYIFNKIIKYIRENFSDIIISENPYNQRSKLHLYRYINLSQSYKFDIINLGFEARFKKMIKYIDNQAIYLFKSGLLLGYSNNKGSNSRFEIVIKDITSLRIKPPRFVYHATALSNLESIKKDGLVLKSIKDGNYSDQTDLIYVPSIFAATDSYKTFGIELILEIDTHKINNKWWIDLNTENFYHIMTFEAIPPEAIKPFQQNEINT